MCQASLQYSQETQSELGKQGFFPSPQGRGWGPSQPWMRNDTPSLVPPSQKGLTMMGRSWLVWAAQWEGAHPQASCQGGKDWVA